MNVQHPIIGAIKGFTQHEGLGFTITDVEGRITENGFQQIATEIKVGFDEIPELIGQRLWEKVTKIGEELTSKTAQMLYRTIGEAAERVGNTVNAGGAPPTPELLLEMFEKVDMSFDQEGKPTNTFVLHPDAVPALKAVAETIESDPILNARHEDILRRKRAAFAVRESNRTLVD
jgi:hypothetical protein